MSQQKYAAGDVVRVSSHSLSGPVTNGDFRIVRSYPLNSAGILYYRVSSIAGPYERMVPEAELSLRAQHAR